MKRTSSLTFFEPELSGMFVQVLEFHKYYYFDLGAQMSTHWFQPYNDDLSTCKVAGI